MNSRRMRNLAVLLLPICWQVGHVTQVCTTVEIGGEEFYGVSGTSDNNIVAVGKDGGIFHFDGSSWAQVSSPTTEDLLDVEMIAPNLAFAVGKKGTVLRWNGIAWIELTTPTDKDLSGVWGDSASDVWVAGKNGTLLSWDGSSWTDQSAAAATSGRELVDAWGDAASFYGLDKDGWLYRYDRAGGAWDAPDTTCDVGGGNFEDLWGNSSGQIYLVKKDEVHLYDGVSCNVVASASKDLLGVYGSGSTVVAVGKDGRVLEYDGVSWVETILPADDLRDVWVSAAGNAYYVGKKGELTTCECSDCFTPGLEVSHDNFGIHCLAETIDVNAIDAVSGNPNSNFSGEITLATGSGRGSWSLITGTGTFADAVPDDGLATYNWPLGATTARFSLYYPEGAPAIDIDAYLTADSVVRDDDTEGLLQFSASGFTVTANPLSNPPPAVITPFDGPVTAATDNPVYIAAYGQLPNDPQCGVIESYDGTRPLSFWSDYLDPVAGSQLLQVDGAGVATSEVASSSQSVAFVNGQASVILNYADAGRVQLLLKDDSGSHPDLPGGIRGATAPFVSRPARFAISNIVSGATTNPGATDANGPVFIAAGDPFGFTVTALNALGNPTPNFGQEVVAESVSLTPSLVVPVAGANPPLAFTIGLGGFAGGSASGTDFSWGEVGVMTLMPSVADGDYLGSGDVTGDASGPIGRFIPHHFTTTVNAPVFATACDSGGFTYLGQPFNYQTVPQMSVTAESAANTTTANYTASLWKLTNASLANRLYSTASSTLDTTGLPPASSDPVIVDSGNGTGTLTFASGSGLRFTRTTEVAPFDADITLSIDVIDGDNVTAANPVQFGSPGGIAFTAGREQRYGRISVGSALGSEVVDLPVPMQSEYFTGAGSGYTRNLDDSCTTGVTLTLGNFAGNLAAGETCVMDSGSPGQSGAGCAAPAPAPSQYREPPLAGDFNLTLRAPGAGNDGATTVTATLPDWLRYDWDSALPGAENPSGRITFGIYSGSDLTIYQREIY